MEKKVLLIGRNSESLNKSLEKLIDSCKKWMVDDSFNGKSFKIDDEELKNKIMELLNEEWNKGFIYRMRFKSILHHLDRRA